MANFSKAIEVIINIEGGYVDDPDDRGGETFMGISRVANPRWKGWHIIDKYKDGRGLSSSLLDDAYLKTLAKQLYKKKYWDIFKGDSFASEGIAKEMLDIGVNMGRRSAIRFLQTSLNAVNTSSLPDLKVDGRIGRKSLALLTEVMQKGLESYIVLMLNILQGRKYISIGVRKKTQRKFMKGWLKYRVHLSLK